MTNLKNNRSIFFQNKIVYILDQTKLPFKEELYKSSTYQNTCFAIKNMLIRGAGSIGAAAGFAMMQASFEAPNYNRLNFLNNAKKIIEQTRPTAQDLFAAVERVYNKALSSNDEAEAEAQLIADETAEAGRLIGIHGNELIKTGSRILTHCNAGTLALVDYGSALAPIIHAHNSGKQIFVYVDETRPRNQGAKLTAWELNKFGVPHVIIADNAAGMLMADGKIDLIITGADRIAKNGDTANKIGTLEKAVLAKEFNIPFYIAAPFSTFDKTIETGKNIPIEIRDENEILTISGADITGKIHNIRIASPGSKAYNPAFDVTPSKYISAFITPKGILSSEELKKY
jgi:S-methyl-5-thioribose-1-phosphate isomerase